MYSRYRFNSGNSDSGHKAAMIMLIIFGIIGIALAVGLIYIIIRRAECEKSCLAGTCSLFGSCNP